jgi:ribulose 1,5-bisphosphate carboxylase large subunit-like protein
MKPCFAVAEGDLTISDVWDNIYSLGPDVMLEVCSGILNYPGGPYDGAQAFLTLVENLSHRMSHEEGHDKIMEIASRDAIVRQGLDSFGYQPTSEE